MSLCVAPIPPAAIELRGGSLADLSTEAHDRLAASGLGAEAAYLLRCVARTPPASGYGDHYFVVTPARGVHLAWGYSVLGDAFVIVRFTKELSA